MKTPYHIYYLCPHPKKHTNLVLVQELPKDCNNDDTGSFFIALPSIIRYKIDCYSPTICALHGNSIEIYTLERSGEHKDSAFPVFKCTTPSLDNMVWYFLVCPTSLTYGGKLKDLQSKELYRVIFANPYQEEIICRQYDFCFIGKVFIDDPSEFNP